MEAARKIPVEPTADREIFITRVFDAPRELVWEAWTNPEHVANWWGPLGFTTTIENMDVRPGGEWTHVMHGPDGTDYPNHSVFLEVVKPERIVYSHGGSREDGPEARFLSTWTFEAIGAKGQQTRITMHALFPTAAARDTVVREYGAIEGGQQTLQRLAEHLGHVTGNASTTPDFVISRVLAAPRELVYQSFTDAERMQHWWGPKGCTVTLSRMDLRPGGTYLYGMKTPDGSTMWGRFVYREIVAPKRLVFVNSFSDEAGGLTRHPLSPTWPLELLTTITFEEQGATTLLTVRWSVLPTTPQAERATFAASHASMAQGWGGTLEQLTGYLDLCSGAAR